MKRGQNLSLAFPKLLIVKERLLILLQYHRGGFSRCTLIVCFGSVMYSQRPEVVHPSATSCTRTVFIGALGTCAMPSRLVFTFISSFLSFFSECSSINFTYTLAFSTGTLFSPPVTSMVMRVCTSLAGGGVRGLDGDASAFLAATPRPTTEHATMHTHAKNFVEHFINRYTPWSTEHQAGSSLATLRWHAASTRGAAPALLCRGNHEQGPFDSSIL